MVCEIVSLGNLTNRIWQVGRLRDWQVWPANQLAFQAAAGVGSSQVRSSIVGGGL